MSLSSVMAIVPDTKSRNLFTLAEAAELLHWSVKSIMKYHAKGQVKLVPWGRGWRMHRTEIERLERNGVGPEED